jgi:hypothetical protein
VTLSRRVVVVEQLGWGKWGKQGEVVAVSICTILLGKGGTGRKESWKKAWEGDFFFVIMDDFTMFI